MVSLTHHALVPERKTLEEAGNGFCQNVGAGLAFGRFLQISGGSRGVNLEEAGRGLDDKQVLTDFCQNVPPVSGGS